MKRVFIVHGWEGTPEKDWMPYLKHELVKRGFDAIVPRMPNTENPKMDEWVPYLNSQITNPDENTFIVAHSLGCITTLRVLEDFDDKQKIGGAIFVGGFGHDLNYKDYNGELASFFEKPIDWEKIKTRANKFVVIHSEDDEWVPVLHNKIYKDKLAAESIVLNGFGHFTAEEGSTEVPIVLQKLLEIAK